MLERKDYPFEVTDLEWDCVELSRSLGECQHDLEGAKKAVVLIEPFAQKYTSGDHQEAYNLIHAIMPNITRRILEAAAIINLRTIQSALERAEQKEREQPNL